jgi:PqqA peptide cyclase
MIDAPLGLIAELTYRCPLHCPYCSNPVDLARYSEELSGEEWLRLLDEARRLGVLQLHLSGGEPLARRELPELVERARHLDMYTNLVTSGLGLSERRLGELVDAGLDHVQLSIQDAETVRSDAIAGTRSFARKLAAAAAIKRRGLPLTINVVLHRANADRVGEIADLAAVLGANRLELAHTQYYGWGQLNRANLLPSRRQVELANAAVDAARTKHGEEMEVIYVLPDLYESRPKPCMYGWGSRHIVIAPNGDVLPCTAAAQIPWLRIDNVRTRSLEGIWYQSDTFNRFRGTAWMPEPCKSCAFREVDFGGCRCQALQLLGDASATDPVCELSPQHHVVTKIVDAAQSESTPPPSTDRVIAAMMPRPSR